MASNDIISTNVPSKVPTTDTEEYPVQQKENKKVLSSHAIENYVHPPIYMEGNFIMQSGVGYMSCGDRFTIGLSDNTTLQEAWQCGILRSLPVSKSAASHTLKASLMMYLLLLVGYFVYE